MVVLPLSISQRPPFLGVQTASGTSMARLGDWIRKRLYRNLSFRNYLRVLSKMYFVAFDGGLLRRNRQFDYPYFLDKVVRRGDVCVDIGANLGYITVLLARRVGASGRVYAVEPVADMREILSENIRRFPQVILYPYALGAEEKPIRLGNDTVADKGYVGTGQHYVMDGDHDESATMQFDAQMKRGSQLFGDLERLNFLKCDIEGYETVVIPEMEPVIRKYTPIVLLESGGEGRRRMMDFFDKLDYQAFELWEAQLYPAARDGSRDLFFIPPSRLPEVDGYIQVPSR